MNKKLCSVYLTFASATTVIGQNINSSLIVKGMLENIPGSTPYVYAVILGGSPTFDSSKIVNGTYYFKNNIAVASQITLYCYPPDHPLHLKSTNIFSFVSEPTTVQITHKEKFDNANVIGSKANTEYLNYEQAMVSYSDRFANLFKQQVTDSNRTTYAEAENAIFRERMVSQATLLKSKQFKYINPLIISFFLGNSGSVVTRSHVDFANDIYNTFSPLEKQSFYGLKTKKILDSYEIDTGKLVINFSQLNLQGNLVKLNEYRKGKYVLIDFWASWCGPCRKESPYLVDLYKKYANKNFTIIGVSLDSDKKLWANAVEQDGLLWEQVSDLKFWNNEVARLYKVAAVPAKFLIDPKGKIIFKLVGGDDEKQLERKLKEIFSNDDVKP